MKILFLIFIFFIFAELCSCSTPQSLLQDFHPEEQCTIRCPLQNNQTEETHFDVGCGPDCKIEQCARGCKLWDQALQAGCQSVCNGTQEFLLPKELYCVIGCNDALNRYFQKLKDVIGTPPPPALVADTLTSTSLRLEWEGIRVPNISYLVQWRYEEIADTWQYCRNQSWGPHPTVHVENLQPYTKYRFRIALLLSPHDSEPIVSAPSLVISTLPAGMPSSPPTIVRATPADPTRVSLSWEPGPFPNGPILSYVLQINELPDGYSALKDIPASENKDFYMFQNLQPARNYSVIISMRNGAGLGPPASTIVTTPALSRVKETQQLILILGTHHTVISQTADMIDEPIIMYKTTHFIKGVAVHVRRDLLFVSDSSGMVWVTSSKEYTPPSSLLGPPSSNWIPHDLSVDWLNNQLYILVQVLHSGTTLWQVVRCNLDGYSTTVAVAGLLTKPHHMEVDPYNGYLFWVVRGGGLYRLDLAEVSNGIRHETSPDLILQDPDLGAFSVDHTSFRILVPQHNKNTVLAVSLDGHEVTDIRNNTQQPQFQNVVSLAMANGLFYWTNGEKLFTEEYHSGQNSYFHNIVYPDIIEPNFVTISVNIPSSQPIPLPVNPPTGLQAVFGSDIAKTSWQIPHLLGGQGKGAWQNWSYILSVQKVNSAIDGSDVNEKIGPDEEECRDINSTWHTVHSLQSQTEYVVRTAAYTSAGVGPWSTEFRGKTLKQSDPGKEPSILWAAAEGLLLSDVIGDNVQTLLHRENLKDEKGIHHITDIAWYRDQLYLVANTSNVYWYNLTSHNHGRLKDMESVGSIAVDWVGKKLYWSKPKQQLIVRGNMNGSQHEPLPILTVAKELNVDAIEGFIYWSTGHAVECARLNGKQRKTYYPAELFSGKQVMGLTLDMDRRGVYWIVRSYEGSTLYRAVMADELKLGEEVEPQKISSLQYPNMQGPLCYFDDHLVWLRDDHNAVIGNMEGQYSAVLSGLSLSELSAVAILDTALHPSPKNIDLDSVNVIPESITADSFAIEGTFDLFFIKWAPVKNVNYGQVFYELKIQQPTKRDTVVETTEVYWRSSDGLEDLPPYTLLTVSLRALTYWGVSPQVTVQLYSPPSTPSAPTNPRVFVSYMRNPIKEEQEILAVFRWDSPVSPNGIILNYEVYCSVLRAEIESCNLHKLNADKQELIVPDIPHNTTIFFKVAACTEVGCGENTHVVQGDSGVEMPVPRLLVSTVDAVEITDCDKRENRTLTRSGSVIDLAYLSQDDRAYWIDDNNHIAASQLDSSGKTKLLSLNGTGLCLAVDWIGRFLYWAEHEEGYDGTVVRKLDLNRARSPPTTVFVRPNPILKIEVSPLNSMIYWVEEESNHVGKLMKSQSDGTNMQHFFSRDSNYHTRSSRNACDCPESPNVGSTMTLDHQTGGPEPRLLWIDAAHNYIMSADMNACVCSLLVNTSVVGNAGLPPTSITVDHKLVYWSNATEGRVYSLAKNTQLGNMVIANLVSGVTAFNASGVRNIAAVGQHLQPYPVARCLTPKPPGMAELVDHKSDSITIGLPLPERDPDCSNVSLATVQFSVYYGTASITLNDTASCLTDLTLCHITKSFDQTVKIDGLLPFTKYVFFIGLQNHYSELQHLPVTIGPPVVFQTLPGAPSAPRDVMVTVINPTAVRVMWEPPKQLNAESVWYEVLWRTETVVEGVRRKGEQPVLNNPSENNLNSVDLLKLIPGQDYLIWVRAYSESSEIYLDSDSVSVTTYPLPNNITLVQAFPYSLNISWNSSLGAKYVECVMQYYDVSAAEWLSVPVTNSTNDGINYYFVEKLSPKTRYMFRLNILYSSEADIFLWPPDNRFTFRTLGDRPAAPGIPVLHHLRGDVYQVAWEPSKENGGIIELYCLEGRQGNGNEQQPQFEKQEYNNLTTIATMSTTASQEWSIYYNGTENYWIITELSSSSKYQFRVQAKNRYGWSDYSATSEWFDLTTAAMLAQQELALVLWALPPLVITSLLLIIGSFLCMFRQREKEKKGLQMMTAISLRSGNTDVELATLREMPRRGNFVHNSNALYTAADFIPTDRELALLPHISREQITLTKFLGSGAFGEVFEGKAKSLPNSGNFETRVAVKTLRKGASEQEKGEFLKEAQLMGNFQHEHILQLLGVCLDNDPSFIIMELMEGGDLLSYLRANRPLIHTESGLTLVDLLAMSVDVARGCRYLEEMHFVHRDLACRNCLVSSTDPSTRIVKIGDFGLARDIYKNDYYRKEGEGLLPVRWMAPESLVDGVFTSQSDVWAFGVLIWEIMSLGQQPYPARNNLEVLHYVRSGGRLGRPINSTDDMYELMLKCWSFHQESRPTFKYCLDILEQLKAKCQPTRLVSTHNGHIITSIQSSSTLKTENNDNAHDRRMSEVAVDQGSGSAANVPRYLELLYDEGDTGYEIPRPHEHQNTPTRDSGHASTVEEDISSLEHLLPHKNITLTPNSSLRYSNMIKTTTDNSSNSNLSAINNNSELR
ncbi:receptor protein-tyrosine kinase sevenless [Lycorma delicatula]|uniref:receptor protein-tyrosine kinase sevenless n=1 Tax=Lycorma delicatula TaxID=130591 RepID=UPI003F5140B2